MQEGMTDPLPVGPMIGGLLSDPAGNHPELFGDVKFFLMFPYCLPCLVTGGLSLFGAIIGIFFMEETHPRKIAKKVSIPECFLLPRPRDNRT